MMKCTECPEYSKCRSRDDLRIKRHRCLKAKEPKVYTNADRIRTMSDEEMAKFLNRHAHDPWTSPSGGWSDWLQQPCGDSPTVEKG